MEGPSVYVETGTTCRLQTYSDELAASLPLMRRVRQQHTPTSFASAWAEPVIRCVILTSKPSTMKSGPEMGSHSVPLPL